MNGRLLMPPIILALLMTVIVIGIDMASSIIFQYPLSLKGQFANVVLWYLLCLLYLQRQVAGIMLLGCVNLAIIVLILVTSLSLNSVLVVLIALIWVNRILLCHTRVTSVLLDMLLCFLSLLLIRWLLASGYTFSLGVWSFFLFQAMYVLLPVQRLRLANRSGAEYAANFDYAASEAEQAIKQLNAR